MPDQTGRRVVVTGANSGTGAEAARRFAAAGAHVVLAVRSTEKGDAAADRIREQRPDASLEVRRLDLADLASVREFADGLLADADPVHVLVNNAGVMAPRRRFETVDGFELQFGTNFLGPFALTVRLLPKLLHDDRPRVATMSSIAAEAGRIRFDDLQWRRRYSPWLAYGQSKLADLLLAQHLAQLSTERGWALVSTAAHPGYTRTNLQSAGRNLGRSADEQRAASDTPMPWNQSVEQGVEPLLYAAADAHAAQGAYYGPDRFGLVGQTTLVRPPRTARSADLARSTWAVAERLTGVSVP